MLVSAIAILFTGAVDLREPAPSRFHSPAHLGNMMAHVLRRIAVRDALPPLPAVVLTTGATLPGSAKRSGRAPHISVLAQSARDVYN